MTGLSIKTFHPQVVKQNFTKFCSAKQVMNSNRQNAGTNTDPNSQKWPSWFTSAIGQPKNRRTNGDKTRKSN